MSNFTTELLDTNTPQIVWIRPEIMFLTLSITTFYRKSFTFASHGQLALCSILGFVIIRFYLNVLWFSLLVGVILQDLVKKIHSYDCQDVFNNVVMYCCLLWLEVALANGTHLWPVILFLSPAQLIRRPHSLKDVLRPIRVSLGPVSIITSMAAASSQLCGCLFYELPAPGVGLQLFYMISSLLGVVSVFGAGVIFRPDNSTVLDLFGKLNISYRDKVNYHAFFNGIILIAAMINVVFEQI